MDNNSITANATESWTGNGSMSSAYNSTLVTIPDFDLGQCKDFPANDIVDLRDDEEQAATYVLKESLKNTMLPVLYTVLVVGVSANLAFFYVIARVPHMRNNTNLFLANLAVADIAFIVISVAMYATYFSEPVRSNYATAQHVGCIGAFVGQYITYYASIGLVTLVTAERYASICRPLRHRSMNTRRRAIKLIISSWILSFILSGVAMLRYLNLDLKCIIWPDTDRFRGLSVIAGYCLPFAPWGLLLANLTEAIPFIAAFAANICMYVGIIRRLSNRSVLKISKDNQAASLSLKAHQVRRQVSKMLIVNGVIFFLCNTPFVGISLAFIVSHLRGVPLLKIYESMAGMVVISHGMLFLNSAINPFVYNVTSKHYRDAFVDAFCCADTSERPRLDSSSLAVVSGSKKQPIGERHSINQV
ncbi:thyrotropin-releasing hormone receptor-like [Acanthaster planci]|uniref:Thyrotropin-releasing hormone receptor-like n=1 Tax=Acanthaster planci TaxID=133434 RepID=A0A8B7YR27_ACAPL|nr:thyrotropin-releasing hormone receptor-like [Acanthaster planci]